MTTAGATLSVHLAAVTATVTVEMSVAMTDAMTAGTDVTVIGVTNMIGAASVAPVIFKSWSYFQFCRPFMKYLLDLFLDKFNVIPRPEIYFLQLQIKNPYGILTDSAKCPNRSNLGKKTDIFKRYPPWIKKGKNKEDVIHKK